MRTRYIVASVAALGLMIPPGAHAQPLPVWASRQTSANWAGYAVVEGNVTGVYGTFSIPAITGATPGLASTWVGIGGAASRDLLQGGVEEDSLIPSRPQYHPFIDLVPAGESTLVGGCAGDLTCTVRPGDVFSVDIHLADAATDAWIIGMADDGHWSVSIPVDYASSQSSAEWIFEATSVVAVPTMVPQTTMTTFGPLARTPVRGNQFSIGGGPPHVLGSGQPVLEQMAIGFALPEATASAIAPDGDGFNTCAYAANCPTPGS